MIDLKKEEDKYKKTVELKKEVCDILDTLRPYEIITITADKEGYKDRVLLTREQKIILKGKK